MQVACGHCGTQHLLKDEALAGHSRVQFQCSKCGKRTIVELPPVKRPDMTMVISPLPSFARGSAGSGKAEMPEQYEGLKLPAAAQVVLRVVSGPAKGLVHRLEKPRVILGREGADVLVEDPEISRQHCALEIKDRVIRLKDLDSTNGTFLEDERVRAAELQSGAEFRIGSSVVRVTLEPK
jgi:hypothetical protein